MRWKKKVHEFKENHPINVNTKDWNRINVNYTHIERELASYLSQVDRLLVNPSMVKKGLRYEQGWDMKDPQNQEMHRGVIKIQRGLRFILQELVGIETTHKRLEDEQQAHLEEIEQRDREREVDDPLERLQDIAAKFEIIWSKGKHLEKRKEKIILIDKGFNRFTTEIKRDPGWRFTKKNVDEIRRLGRMLKELGEINTELLRLMGLALGLEQQEFRLQAEEDELLIYLIRGMREHHKNLGKKIIGKGGYSETLRKNLEIIEKANEPAHLTGEGGHFATDLLEKEKILHTQVTPRIIIIYNETIELGKLLKDENSTINRFSQLIEGMRVDKRGGGTSENPENLATHIIDLMKELKQYIIKDEKPLFEKISKIQKMIERVVHGLITLEREMETISRRQPIIQVPYNLKWKDRVSRASYVDQRRVESSGMGRARRAAQGLGRENLRGAPAQQEAMGDPDEPIRIHPKDLVHDDTSLVRGDEQQILTEETTPRGQRTGYGRTIRNHR